jgi:hypothetical protein
MPEIEFPADFEKKADRALRQLGKYVAACLWCGHGYEDISPELQDEHFADHCPDAPKDLIESARSRVQEAKADVHAPKESARKETTSNRRCRRKRS